MNAGAHDFERTALGFARSEVSWEAFRSFGIDIVVQGAAAEVQTPPGVPIVRVSAGDIATGFLRHWVSGSELQEWATVLLAAGFIDFPDLDDQPAGDALLEGLWSASAGEPISKEAVASAQELVNGDVAHRPP